MSSSRRFLSSSLISRFITSSFCLASASPSGSQFHYPSNASNDNLGYMRAMVLSAIKDALRESEVPRPQFQSGEVLIRIKACAVCRTDLHIVDGELPDPKLPLIPGHQIVGRVVDRGPNAQRYNIGDRVGIPWLGRTCGTCRYCQSGQENLCDFATFTGYTRDGGFAEFAVADERFCVAIPDSYGDVEAAPLLCAGMIGFRSLTKTHDARRLGIFGFGAAAL